MTAIKEFQTSLETAYKNYVKSATTRSQLADIYLGALVVLGVLQFVFAVLVGSFPFNAFLAGFISTVGQFVLVVSLKLQSFDDKGVFSETPERAIGDFIFASVILHFIVWHFIN